MIDVIAFAATYNGGFYLRSYGRKPAMTKRTTPATSPQIHAEQFVSAANGSFDARCKLEALRRTT